MKCLNMGFFGSRKPKWYCRIRFFLHPISLLRTELDIDFAVELYRESGARSVVSVHKVSEHPSECVAGIGGWRYLALAPADTVLRQDY